MGNSVIRATGLCMALIVCGQVQAAGQVIVEKTNVVNPTPPSDERVFVQQIVLDEAGSYSLKIDQNALSATPRQVSAMLAAGARKVLQSEGGLVSPAVNLQPGTYSLFMHYSLPVDAPWLTLETTVFKSGAAETVVAHNVLNPVVTAGERVIDIPLDRESYEVGSDGQATLHVRDLSDELSDIALSGLNVQVVDSKGVQATLSGEGDLSFPFSEDARLLVHATFAEAQDEAILDIRVADRSVEGDGLVLIDRTPPAIDVSGNTPSQSRVPVVAGKPVTVTLRGVDLGEADDETNILVTTLSQANTYKYTTPDLYNKTVSREFVADNDSIYIAGVAGSGDMAVVVSVRDEAGNTLFENIVAGSGLIRLGSFKMPSAQQAKATLTDLNFPIGFDSVKVSVLSSDAAQVIPTFSTRPEQRRVERRQAFRAGKYHVLALVNQPANVSGSLSFVVESANKTYFETLHTLGIQTASAQPFTLSATSDISVHLQDLEFPVAIDQASVALFSRDAPIASGNNLIRQTLPPGRYFIAVDARSDTSGVYHLQADATPTAPENPGEGEVPPRNVNGSGSGGGGGSMSWDLVFMLVALFSFTMMRHVRESRD